MYFGIWCADSLCVGHLIYSYFNFLYFCSSVLAQQLSGWVYLLFSFFHICSTKRVCTECMILWLRSNMRRVFTEQFQRDSHAKAPLLVISNSTQSACKGAFCSWRLHLCSECTLNAVDKEAALTMTLKHFMANLPLSTSNFTIKVRTSVLICHLIIYFFFKY